MEVFWKWDNAVSPEMCDILLNERKLLLEEAGRVDGNQITSARNSRVCWVKQNHWVEAVLYNHALYANESAGWNFAVGRPEIVQLAAYNVGEFYNWHEDWFPLERSNTVRKLSVVLMLSDPKDFEGGHFEFDENKPVDLKRGTLIVFPSFVRHRVTPVTKGTRYSAVCWVNGPKVL